MYLEAMALIGANKPVNLVHIILNNEAHESVSGMPTVARALNLPAIARACGYPSAVSVDTPEGLDRALAMTKAGNQLTFIKAPRQISIMASLYWVTPFVGERAVYTPSGKAV